MQLVLHSQILFHAEVLLLAMYTTWGAYTASDYTIVWDRFWARDTTIELQVFFKKL